MITQPELERMGQLNKIACVLDRPEVGQKLGQMPDLKVLLEDFQRHSTVQLFLKDNKVLYVPNQIREFNRDLRSFLFGNRKNHQVRTLLRKATFSRWLYTGTNWYGTDWDTIVNTMNRNAQFVCSKNLFKYANAKAYTMKAFLDSVMAREFTDTINNHDDLEMFASRNESGVANRDHKDDIDVAQTFGNFANSLSCPSLFNSLVREYIEGAKSLQSIDRLVASMYKDLYYSPAYKMDLVSAGLVFIENTLLMKPKELPTLEKLTVDRKKEMNEFRQLFQQAIPASLIRSSRS